MERLECPIVQLHEQLLDQLYKKSVQWIFLFWTWNDQLVPELLAHQEQAGPVSGSWAPTDAWSRMGGRVYQTAVCTLSLEVYYRYRTR